MGAIVDDNSAGNTEMSGATEKVVARVKKVVQDDANALKPNYHAQHCAIALGFATENEQQNANEQICISLALLTTFL